jgi:hypothetical protein
MDKSIDLSDFVTAKILGGTDPTTVQNRSYASSSEPSANENLDGCEQLETPLTSDEALLNVEHWKPTEPQFCRDIASHYRQGKRTIQKWVVELRKIAPWFTDTELKLSDDRYTPLAVELLGYRYFAGSTKKWEKVLTEQYIDRVAATNIPSTSEIPITPTKVLPSQDESSNYSSRLTLHIGASSALPTIPGIVPSGNDAAYLLQAQQRLQQFEELQQQAIAQMQQQHEQAQALNAQYQEAVSLSDQLLLQEFQLKGVQLGYTALQLKQQAFKATVQAAEAGTLPVPGKLQPESAQASSD